MKGTSEISDDVGVGRPGQPKLRPRSPAAANRNAAIGSGVCVAPGREKVIGIN